MTHVVELVSMVYAFKKRITETWNVSNYEGNDEKTLDALPSRQDKIKKLTLRIRNIA